MSSRPLAVIAAAMLLIARPTHAQQDFTVAVDARETARGILHVKQTFPAKPGGTLALSYPQWIPGEHGPTGPNVDVAGLFPRAGERILSWSRDPVNINTIRIAVPAGVRSVDLSFDFLLDNGTSGFTSAACATPNLLLLSWNQVAFYPAGKRSDDLRVAATLQLPDRWSHASALDELPAQGAAIAFAPCTFTRLVDSPVLSGEHMRTVELTAPGDSVPVRLRMACDSEVGLGIKDAQVTALKQLVKEARALFGTQHYRHYDFLLTLSDHVAQFGLEHHESSDDRVAERYWLDDDQRVSDADLLSHEYVHSWNGKFRRPARLATGDYFTPMQGDLLFVYEGLTQYLGFVLAARSGLRTPVEMRDKLGHVAATIESNRGRVWRPLVDTGTQAQELYEARGQWHHWRRGVDFYDEGLLMWLEADVLIRTLSKGTRSMDDFCQRFHGGVNQGPEVKPYELDDVVATLNAVWPYDWKGFLQQHVYQLAPHAPMNGITHGGWQLTYTDSLGPYQHATEEADKKVNEDFSLGITLNESGVITDLVPGSPADAVGLAPDMKVIAVNGRRYSKNVLRDALAATPGSGRLELLCEVKEFYRTFLLAYRDGRRHPVLVRENGTRDVVTEVTSARAR